MGNTVLFHVILSVTSPIIGCHPYQSVQYSTFLSTKEEPIDFFPAYSYSCMFEGDLRVEIILDQETQKLSGQISYKSLFYIAQITDINIATLSKGIIYQT